MSETITLALDTLPLDGAFTETLAVALAGAAFAGAAFLAGVATFFEGAAAFLGDGLATFFTAGLEIFFNAFLGAGLAFAAGFLAADFFATAFLTGLAVCFDAGLAVCLETGLVTLFTTFFTGAFLAGALVVTFLAGDFLAIKRGDEVFCFVLGVNLGEGLVISPYDIPQGNSLLFSQGAPRK